MNKKNKIKKVNTNYILLVIAFLIGIITVILEEKMSLNVNTEFSKIYLFIAGLTMAVGIIVPGVSSTIILMIFGVYNIYLDSVAIMNFNILIPMGLGVSLGCIIWMKITKILLDKYYIKTFYAIIGFTLGSVFVLFPQITCINDCIVCSFYALVSYNCLKIIEK